MMGRGFHKLLCDAAVYTGIKNYISVPTFVCKRKKKHAAS